MTVIYHGNNLYSGLTADTKPTTGVTTNSWYFDTQLRILYSYNGSAWNAFSIGSGITLATPTLTTPTITGQKFADVSKITSDSPFTLTATNSIIRIDNSAGTTNFVLNLPTAAAIAGTTYIIRRTDSAASTNVTIVTPSGSETIGGVPTWRLYPAESLEIESNGTNWTVLRNAPVSELGYYHLAGATADRCYIAGFSYGGSSTLGLSTTAPAIDTLWAIPMVVSRITKFDVIRFRVSTLAGAGGVARAGIYYDNGNCYPGARMFDTGSIAVDAGSTSNPRDTTITSTLQTFQPGLYWLAWECGVAAPQIAIITLTTGLVGVMGHASLGNGITTAWGLSVTHAFGALPDPFTAGASILTVTPAATAPAPAIALRAV